MMMHMMRKFEKCQGATESTRLPQRSTGKVAGYDFFSPVPVTIGPKQWGMIKTNVKAQMEDDDVLLIFPRSSLGIKKHLMLANTTGVIDADYYNNSDNEGNIILALYNYGDREQHISPGDKVAQGVFVKYGVTADDVTVSKRERVGGVGSTGK